VDWKGTANFVIISLWLWAVDLWADLKRSDRNTQFYFGCGTVAKQCGLLGLWVDWKGTVNFVIISLWLWAVDLWADLK
jgi:hypothetical protein